MSKQIKPTPVQLAALKEMLSGGLRRLPGGFWTTTAYRQEMIENVRLSSPRWHVAAGTIQAMQRRGWIERANVHKEDWRDDRVLTASGRALAEARPARSPSDVQAFMDQNGPLPTVLATSTTETPDGEAH